MSEVAIVGGGIGGLCAAIGLGRAGFEPVVYEATSELDPVGAGIWITPNGMAALDRLGVADDVERRGTVVAATEIRSRDGRPIVRTDFDEYVAHGDVDRVGVAVHRATLQAALLDHVPDDAVRLGTECVAVDPAGPTARFDDGTTIDPAVVVGADGIGSAVRRSLDPDATPTFAGEVAFRGVADREPPGDPDAGVEYWGEGDRFGWSAIDGGRVYWFATMPASSPDALADHSVGDLADRLRPFGSFAVACVESTGDDGIVRTPLADVGPLDRWSRGPVTLLGDAAHAMTPNLAQGSAQAMEDAAALAAAMDAAGPTADALARYEAARKRRADRIVRQSRLQGTIAGIERPWLRWLRNAAFRYAPGALVRRQVARQFSPTLSA